MRKVICEHGHFYDGDKYDTCPTCQNIQESRENISVPVETDQGGVKKKGVKKKDAAESKKGLFGRAKRGEVVHTLPLPPEENGEAEIKADASPAPVPAKPREHKGTLALWQLEEEESSFASEVESAKQLAAAADIEEKLKEEKKEESKTVAFYGMEDEPATGFLICIKGAAKGTSYQLKTGQNFIGRGLNMDVILNQEPSVSRSKHAIISYEPKKKEFYIQPGESSGLTYLNDDMVMGFSKLSAYDRIQVGDCVLSFLPFCGEKFSWDEEESN